METIYAYTDNEATEDGFIHQLLGSHRITNNAFEALKEYHKGYNYNDGEYLRFFANETMILAPFAIKKYNAGGIMKTDFRFKVGNFKHSKVLWLMPNEVGGITVMKPEDY